MTGTVRQPTITSGGACRKRENLNHAHALGVAPARISPTVALSGKCQTIHGLHPISPIMSRNARFFRRPEINFGGRRSGTGRQTGGFREREVRRRAGLSGGKKPSDPLRIGERIPWRSRRVAHTVHRGRAEDAQRIGEGTVKSGKMRRVTAPEGGSGARLRASWRRRSSRRGT